MSCYDNKWKVFIHTQVIETQLILLIVLLAMHCLKGFSTIILKINLGQMCLLCSTVNFLNLFGTAPGTVRPATCLPQIRSQIQMDQQQCAAEFFQEFCRVLGHTANQYQSKHLIPTGCNLAFLRFFFCEPRSEVMCLSCNSITSATTMETILPLHITKVWANMVFICFTCWWRKTKVQ